MNAGITGTDAKWLFDVDVTRDTQVGQTFLFARLVKPSVGKTAHSTKATKARRGFYDARGR